MNEDVALGKDESNARKTIKVYRHDEQGTTELVSDRSQYKPGETLIVQFTTENGSPISGDQFVIEATVGTFPKGGCDGRRIADEDDIEFVMPKDEVWLDSEVLVFGAWAEGHGQVLLTPKFILLPPNGRGEIDPALPHNVEDKVSLNYHFQYLILYQLIHLF